MEFRQLREVGVFSYLLYSLAKSHLNGWGYLEAWMTMFSIPKIGTESGNPLVVVDSPRLWVGLFM